MMIDLLIAAFLSAACARGAYGFILPVDLHSTRAGVFLLLSMLTSVLLIVFCLLSAFLLAHVPHAHVAADRLAFAVLFFQSIPMGVAAWFLRASTQSVERDASKMLFASCLLVGLAFLFKSFA